MLKLNEIPIEILYVTGKVREIRYPRQGCTSVVGIVDGETGTFVLKKTVEKRYRDWHAKEAAVLKSLEKTTLKVPKLFSFIQEDTTWSLTEWMEGETLRNFLSNERSEGKRQEAIYAFGKALAEIHSTECPEDLKLGDNWLEAQLKDAEYWLTHGEVDGNAEILERLKTERPAPIAQTLIHGDFTVDNVLYKNGVITGIIDWGGGAFGDPRYDASLAIRPKAGAFEDKRDIELFFNGYGKKIITEADYEYFENGLYEFF